MESWFWLENWEGYLQVRWAAKPATGQEKAWETSSATHQDHKEQPRVQSASPAHLQAWIRTKTTQEASTYLLQPHQRSSLVLPQET